MGVLEQLRQELLEEIRTKDGFPTGTPSTPYYHGPNGLWGVMGLEREIISTRVQPRGIAGLLPARGSNTMWPMFPYLTGFLDDSGAEPDGVCDDAPTPGPGKNCIQTAAFGRYTRQTRELEIDRVGQQINRGEFQDLILMNPPLLDNRDSMIVPSSIPGGNDFLREALMRMTEVGISFQNLLMKQVYYGNPANNSGGNGYREFPGLDILIGTTKVDAITGTACPSLASDIKNMNYANISSSATAMSAVINALTYMMRTLSTTAENTGMGETRWIIAMRETLFYELSAAWPCSYMTYRCMISNDDGQRLNLDAGDVIGMRDAMRQGRYLIMDGIKYQVEFDSAITEDTNTTNANVPNPCFASDIYVIPMTVRGNTAVTYWEYLNYEAGPLQAAADLGLGNYFSSDGGRWLWVRRPPVNFCVSILGKIEPRIILRTPHLAGRLLNIVYCPLQHPRDAFPDDPYFVNGGVTSRTATEPFSEWNPAD